MGHRGHSESAAVPYGPDPLGRDAQDRTRIAQVAARLIAEHGIADWSLAKRKAARQLMLPERAALPGDDEIEAALAEYHALFGGDEHARSCARSARRRCAGCAALAQFEPVLVGGVAAGWATAHSDIRIELVADDAKAVELALLNAGVAYRHDAASADDGPPSFYIDTPRGGVRLSVRTPEDARASARGATAHGARGAAARRRGELVARCSRRTRSAP